jgi:hypothetical protein
MLNQTSTSLSQNAHGRREVKKDAGDLRRLQIEAEHV